MRVLPDFSIRVLLALKHLILQHFVMQPAYILIRNMRYGNNNHSLKTLHPLVCTKKRLLETKYVFENEKYSVTIHKIPKILLIKYVFYPL